jgi:hypothetical protein
VDQFRYYESEQILGPIGPLTINVNHVLLAAVFAFCLALWLRGGISNVGHNYKDNKKSTESRNGFLKRA